MKDQSVEHAVDALMKRDIVNMFRFVRKSLLRGEKRLISQNKEQLMKIT